MVDRLPRRASGWNLLRRVGSPLLGEAGNHRLFCSHVEQHHDRDPVADQHLDQRQL